MVRTRRWVARLHRGSLAVLCCLLSTSCAVDGPSVRESTTNPNHEFTLRWLRASLDRGEFLLRDSLTGEKVAELVGAKLTAYPSPQDTVESKTIWWDERPAVTQLRPTPTFMRGSINYSEANQLRKPVVRIALTTCVRSVPTCSIVPEMIEKVFGAPNSFREGFPPTPPLHGAPYVPEPTTHPLGNKWMLYTFKSAGSEGRIQFRTLGDGAVLDIQAIYGAPLISR